jgi:hypothetical protein
MFSALLAKARLVARVAARRISACCDEKSFSHVFKTENNVRFFARRSRSGVSRRRSIPSATVVSLNLHKKTPDEQAFSADRGGIGRVQNCIGCGRKSNRLGFAT